MPMTNAEKQAAFRAKREEELTSMRAQIAALTEENTDLHAQLEAAQKKIYSLAIKILKLKAK